MLQIPSRRSALPRLAAGAILTFSLVSACAPPDDESIEVLPTSVLETSDTTALAASAFNEGAVNIPGADPNTGMVSPFGDNTDTALPPVQSPGLVNRAPTNVTSRLTGGATTGGSTTGRSTTGGSTTGTVTSRNTIAINNTSGGSTGGSTSSGGSTTSDPSISTPTGGSTSGSTSGSATGSSATGGSSSGGSTTSGSTSGTATSGSGSTGGATSGSTSGSTGGTTSGLTTSGGSTSGSTTGQSNSNLLYPAGETKGIVFGQYDGGQLKLDLMLPDTGSDWPVVVYIHGGGWYAGGNGIPDTGHLRRLVEDGFAVASIEYRLSSEEIFPAQLYDAELAVSWLRTYAEMIGLDADNIAVMGDSAGGHIAALLGTTASSSDPWAVQAVIARAAPSDLTSNGASDTPSALLQMETRLLGCSPSTCPDRAQWASPNLHATRNAPPFLIEHGLNDTVVPFEHAQILQQALTNAGADSTLITYNGDHDAPEYQSDADYTRVLNFLRRNLT
ncbi:MAG: alpha/beta hydrolase [Actinobacteria bacterium]|nr:alpha/beta hydrolase [Actinomycetota bacterium]